MQNQVHLFFLNKTTDFLLAFMVTQNKIEIYYFDISAHKIDSLLEIPVPEKVL